MVLKECFLNKLNIVYLGNFVVVTYKSTPPNLFTSFIFFFPPVSGHIFSLLSLFLPFKLFFLTWLVFVDFYLLESFNLTFDDLSGKKFLSSVRRKERNFNEGLLEKEFPDFRGWLCGVIKFFHFWKI